VNSALQLYAVLLLSSGFEISLQLSELKN